MRAICATVRSWWGHAAERRQARPWASPLHSEPVEEKVSDQLVGPRGSRRGWGRQWRPGQAEQDCGSYNGMGRRGKIPEKAVRRERAGCRWPLLEPGCWSPLESSHPIPAVPRVLAAPNCASFPAHALLFLSSQTEYGVLSAQNLPSCLSSYGYLLLLHLLRSA